MSKYTNEFKLEVIKYCIEEFPGYGNAAKYFNIPSSETVRRWCKHYEAHGIEGITKNKNNKYDGKFKEIIGNITSAKLRHVDYCYYNVADCLARYDIEGLEIEKYEDYEEKYNTLIEKIKKEIEENEFEVHTREWGNVEVIREKR